MIILFNSLPWLQGKLTLATQEVAFLRSCLWPLKKRSSRQMDFDFWGRSSSWETDFGFSRHGFFESGVWLRSSWKSEFGLLSRFLGKMTSVSLEDAAFLRCWLRLLRKPSLTVSDFWKAAIVGRISALTQESDFGKLRKQTPQNSASTSHKNQKFRIWLNVIFWRPSRAWLSLWEPML